MTTSPDRATASSTSTTSTGICSRRFASRHELNSPWGVAVAPTTFGQFAGDILIGNFGNGRINAFDPTSGNSSAASRRAGPTDRDRGSLALQVGNGAAGEGRASTVFFSAGPNDEEGRSLREPLAQ